MSSAALYIIDLWILGELWMWHRMIYYNCMLQYYLLAGLENMAMLIVHVHRSNRKNILYVAVISTWLLDRTPNSWMIKDSRYVRCWCRIITTICAIYRSCAWRGLTFALQWAQYKEKVYVGRFYTLQLGSTWTSRHGKCGRIFVWVAWFHGNLFFLLFQLRSIVLKYDVLGVRKTKAWFYSHYKWRRN